jgi:hypothetical protein
MRAGPRHGASGAAWAALLLLAAAAAARPARAQQRGAPAPVPAAQPGAALAPPEKSFALTAIAGCAGLSPGSDEVLGGLDAACRLAGVLGREET